MIRAPRAVVFDLDDTLADTSGSILEAAHRDTALAMIEAGLRASPPEALAALREIRSADPAAPFAERLVERFGAPEPRACAERGRQAFFGTPREGLRLREGASLLLDELERRGIALFLLTFGDQGVQKGKIAALGIADRFAGVRVVSGAPPAGKTGALAELLEARAIPPAEVWVVGDRPDGEIQAGRTLGCFTVRLRAGEFADLEPQDELQRADRTIRALPELLSLLPGRTPRSS